MNHVILQTTLTVLKIFIQMGLILTWLKLSLQKVTWYIISLLLFGPNFLFFERTGSYLMRNILHAEENYCIHFVSLLIFLTKDGTLATYIILGST